VRFAARKIKTPKISQKQNKKQRATQASFFLPLISTVAAPAGEENGTLLTFRFFIEHELH
jgi:hypothetical protein